MITNPLENGMIFYLHRQVQNKIWQQHSVRKEFLRNSNSHTTCPWKGKAFYHYLEVNGDVIHNGAWFYPHPSTAAATVDGRIAFGDEITIHEN